MPTNLATAATSFGLGLAPVLVGMTVLMVIELFIPLHPRGKLNDTHLGPNLTLTFITFLTNFVFNTAILVLLAWLDALHVGLLRQFMLGPAALLALSIVLLDLCTYIAHVSMHKVPFFWRFHCVHHSDPALDVTTTIRQHPGESLIRYVFMAVPAIVLGVSPAAFVAYRVTSTLIGLTEHSNIRLPLRLDIFLSWFTTSPNMHKVHHSRTRCFTDSNYGNILSLWDRIFGTFTPAKIGTDVDFGLDGFDDSATQTTVGLLVLPGREKSFDRASAVTVR